VACFLSLSEVWEDVEILIGTREATLQGIVIDEIDGRKGKRKLERLRIEFTVCYLL
jgi:hypothetical protein